MVRSREPKTTSGVINDRVFWPHSIQIMNMCLWPRTWVDELNATNHHHRDRMEINKSCPDVGHFVSNQFCHSKAEINQIDVNSSLFSFCVWMSTKSWLLMWFWVKSHNLLPSTKHSFMIQINQRPKWQTHAN